MKKCPACGYSNSAAAPKCAVCGGDLAAVQAAPPPEKERAPDLLPAAGILLALCAAFFYLYQNFPSREAPAPVTGEDAASDEASFDNDGVLYSLDRLRGLRFLPEADKLRVPPLLGFRDERVALAAAEVLGEWARGAADEADRRRWFEPLLEAVFEAGPSVRRQAAVEAGSALLYGLDPAPYAEKIKRASGGLLAEGDGEALRAGFFLASMAGLEEFSAQMDHTLLYDPSREAKLCAACALARLGRPAGHSYLAGVIEDGDPELREKAFDCLRYSSAPETSPYLAALARGRGEFSGPAKRTLMLRKQLAIIKK